MYDDLIYSNLEVPSYIRVFHASPGAPPVDVYANGTKIASSLSYENFTPYRRLKPDRYYVRVYKANTKTNPITESYVEVRPNVDATISIIGSPNNISSLEVLDTARRIPPNAAQVKFVHLSPNAPPVDVYANDELIARNIRYTQSSRDNIVVPANYTIYLYRAGTQNRLLFAPGQNLKDGKYYTIYAVGLADGKPPLQIVTALDKASY